MYLEKILAHYRAEASRGLAAREFLRRRGGLEFAPMVILYRADAGFYAVAPVRLELIKALRGDGWGDA